MCSVTTSLEPTASKALSSFLRRPRGLATFTEVAYAGVPSQDLEPLKLWVQQLPAPSPEVVHTKMSDVTLREKSWMYRCNKMLRQVHPTIRVVWFRYLVDAVQDLCQPSTRKMSGTHLGYGTRVVDTAYLQDGWTANVGVTHVAARKELLEDLPFGVGVVRGEWWESLSAGHIHPQWSL